MVKKLFAYVLLLGILFSTTELAVLFRVPALYHHFLDHSLIDAELDFWDYLQDHYGSDSQHSHSGDFDHSTLPFKSTQNSIHWLVFFHYDTSEFVLHPFSHLKISLIFFENTFDSSYLSYIWQPPKLA